MSLSEIFIMNINEASWLILGHLMDWSIWKSGTLVDHQRSTRNFFIGSQQRPWQVKLDREKQKTSHQMLIWREVTMLFFIQKKSWFIGCTCFWSKQNSQQAMCDPFQIADLFVEKSQLRKITLVTPWRYIWSFNWLWLARHLQNWMWHQVTACVLVCFLMPSRSWTTR